MRNSRHDSILTCDPVVEIVFKGGFGLSLKDLRAVATCTKSHELHCLIQNHARSRLRRSSRSLGVLYRAGGLFATRMRTLIWDIETRLVQAHVPPTAIHPTLASPLCRSGFISPAVIYGDLASLAHAVRLVSHPSAWANSPTSNGTPAKRKLWDVIAASASVTMRPSLVLILSLIIPVEARLSYLTLRHSAYAGAGVHSLGSLVGNILAGMMSYDLSQKDVPRVAKTLRHVAPTLEPLSMYVLRMCRKGVEKTPGQRAAERAALEASLASFFEVEGDLALYSAHVWVPWLLAQEESQLVALYVKYLFDGFQ